MNFARKARFFALAGLMVALVGGIAVSSAEAGYGYGYGYGAVHTTTYIAAPQYVIKPYTYHVTHFDCYGHPYTVLKTAYKKVLLAY